MALPLRLARDEVLRNLVSARVRTVAVLVMCGAIGASVTLATVTDVERVTRTVDQQYAAGSTVLEVVGPSGERVDAVRCHAIGSVGGVLAAGGVMDLTMVRLDVQPDSETRLLTVTPGYAQAAWPTLVEARTAAVVAGSDYRHLSWRAGDTVGFSEPGGAPTPVRLDAVASIRSVLGDERVVVSRAPPTGTVTSCLVLATPAARRAVARAVEGWFGDGTSVSDVFVRSDLVQDPQRLLDTRTSRFGWAFGGVALVVVALAQWVARRDEFALYRLLHVGDRGILAMLTFETVLLVLLPAQVGAAAALGSRPVGELLAVSLSLDVLRLVLVVTAAPVLGMLAVPRGSLLAALKGR